MNAAPVPGAPEGKLLRRTCRHTNAFYLVKAFHGLLIYQCLACRKISTLDVRTDRTCLGCGKPLEGKQRNWCKGKCGTEVWITTDRATWRKRVLDRDGHTCTRCGWKHTDEQKTACEEAYDALQNEYNKGKPYDQWLSTRKLDFMAMKASGYRELEAHHITPLEWGGPEFDLANGTTLCHVCHDEVHRELRKR